MVIDGNLLLLFLEHLSTSLMGKMIKISKKKWIGIITLMTAVIFVYTCVHLIKKKSPHPKSKPTVSAFKIVEKKYQPTIQAVGILQANQGAILKAQTDGEIKLINFTAGQNVRQGDILIELNNSQQKAALKAAIATEILNKSMYQRDVELKKLGAISLAAVDQAKAAMDAGEAAVQEAQAAYDLTITRAAFSGRVGISKVNIGDYLQAGSEIVSLQNLDPMFVDFYVPQKNFPDIKVGASVDAKADTATERIKGKIINYETVIDNNTGMLQVRASIPNPQQSLLPGGYVTLSIDTALASNTISIPQMAVMYDAKGAYVYLVEGNIVHQRRVKLGAQIEQAIQVIEGLKEGDIVVSAGTNKLQDSSEIQVVVDPDEDNT